jgi:plastocyanin domain-containing protein
MNKITPIIIIIALTIGIVIGIVFFGGESKESNSTTNTQTVQNIEKRDDIQYVTINAKGGYSPKVSNAEANIKTKLIVRTSDTYDCSAALIIRSIGYQKTLSQTGQEVIDLGTPQIGTLQGICSMGMYNFSVNFR